jgi:hypothetical protein
MATANDTSIDRVTTLFSDVVASRTEFFRLVEKLEESLGAEIDVQELEVRIDAEMAGRSAATAQEAVAAVRRASPLRVVAVR